MNNLTPSEIKRRLIRGKNLERLHVLAKKRIVILETENKQLKLRIKELEERDRDKREKIEVLSFQLEQIKNKIFGKKPIVERIAQEREKKERDILSYQRPIPTGVTKIENHPIKECIYCHGKLQNKQVKVFFEEDIPLPIQKSVIKHEVEVGYCAACKRQTSGYFIPSKKSILGDNIKKYVCLLSIANRLSHSQIREHLHDMCSMCPFPLEKLAIS